MTQDESTDPRRWTTGAPDSPLEQRMGTALRVAAAATHAEVFAALAPAAASTSPRRALFAMAAAVVLLLITGTVAAAQVVGLVRRAREAAWSVVNVPAGNTVSISRRAGLRIHARGPLRIEGDSDRIALVGEGEARVESGARPIEIVTDEGVAVHLAAGATWAPPVPRRPTPGAAPEPPREAFFAAPSPRRSVASSGSSPSRAVVSRLDELAPSAPTAPSAPIAPPSAAWAATPLAANGNGDEAALVAAAFRALRTEHDPAAALSWLDRHDKSFPSGSLSVEAGMARVEALLALGRSAQALAALEALPSATMTPPRLLLRGQLRAANGRCASARADFAAVEAAGAGELAARARAAAAACADVHAPDETSGRETTEGNVEGTP